MRILRGFSSRRSGRSPFPAGYETIRACKEKEFDLKRPYVKTVVAACLIMSAMIAGTVSFGFFMEPVTSDLGFERSAFSLYFSLVTVVGTATLPVYGRLIAKVGPRRIVIVGGIWTGAAIACLSLCRTLLEFYAVGCLIGLGFFGCSYVAVPVIVANWFARGNGFVMGAAAACGGAVGVVLSLVFPSFIETGGWSAGYVLLGVVVFALTTPVGLLLLRSAPQEMGLAPYGAGETQANAGVEVMNGSVQGKDVSYRQALRSPVLYATVAAFLLYLVTVSVTQHLAAYFASVGFSAVTAGVFMSVISAGIIVTNALAGIISDKLGLTKAVGLCSVLYLASFILLPVSEAVPFICAALVLMSIGNAFASVFAPMVTGFVFGQRDYASLWGIVSMACVLGQAIGAPLWGLSYDLTGGYQPGMYSAAIVVLLAFLLIVWVTRAAARRGGEGN